MSGVRTSLHILSSLCCRYRELGISKTEGFSSDYAFLVRGLLDLFEGTFDDHWLEWAVQLQAKQDKLFLDKQHGGYFDCTAEDTSILLRTKEGEGQEVFFETKDAIACPYAQ